MYTEKLTHEMCVAQIALVDIFGNGYFDLLPKVYDPNWITHDPAAEGLTGYEGRELFITYVRNAFPDIAFTIDDQIQGTDKQGRICVTTIWTATGTHNGELLGLNPTGKSGSVSGINVDHFEKGRIAETETQWGLYQLMEQLKA